MMGKMQQLRFPLLGFGNVVLGSDKMGQDPVAAAHRCHEQMIPEQRSVLAVITQYRVTGALFAQGKANFIYPGLVPVVSLQKIAIATDYLGCGVSSNALESGIDVVDDEVRRLRTVMTIALALASIADLYADSSMDICPSAVSVPSDGVVQGDAGMFVIRDLR